MSKVLLSEQLGAMARVDQLRQHQNEVDEYLSLPQRRVEVAARIREYYQNNGVQFTDAQIDQGVREFFAGRLVFEAPPLGPLAQLWSKVLLNRSKGIRLLQYLAIAALAVQCTRVVLQDSQHKQATQSVSEAVKP